ncbi:MAG: hypothetical protein IT510_03190 [Sulfuritalea sp.]|nr:hypothetical protein [Sulfuritalea sp.]
MTTTISPRRLACRVYRAFRRGDLADLDQLKDALACGNYLDSGDSRPFVADVFHGLDAAALTNLPVKSASASIAAADHCRGESVPCAGRTFFWTETNEWEGELPECPGASWQRDPIRRQLLAYAKDWLQKKRRAAVWLSDFAGSELTGLSAPNLMADLGRLDAQANRRRRVVVFTVKIITEQKVYKPILVDSGFTFYWRAWPSSTEHGMTRSLRDNRPAYREWVVPKAHVEIVDAWPLPVADVSLCESDLDASFWQACRREIEDRRIQKGL